MKGNNTRHSQLREAYLSRDEMHDGAVQKSRSMSRKLTAILSSAGSPERRAAIALIIIKTQLGRESTVSEVEVLRNALLRPPRDARVKAY